VAAACNRSAGARGVCGLARRNLAAWPRVSSVDWVQRERGGRVYIGGGWRGLGVRVAALGVDQTAAVQGVTETVS
jgi:hypothetical protein